jgi:hypothetical protein
MISILICSEKIVHLSIMWIRNMAFAGALIISSRIEANERWWQLFGPPEEGQYAGGAVENPGKLEPEMKKFLASDRFDEWETYEDEVVKLVYPKHPLLKLEVNGGNEGIKVEGGVCTTVDNSFQRAYVLKAGDATYGVFLLTKAAWLDDGICLCGPMVHHAYRVENGCLARFSLLPGGAVKKAQKLGDKLRLMAFEWTHLSCPRAVYEKMVEDMTLKVPNLWNAERLQNEVIRRYGMEGRAGWLAPGQAVSKADETMAKVSTEVDGIRVWRDIQENYPAKIEAAFENGVLVKLTSQGLQRTGEEAVVGSIDWAEDRLRLLIRGPEKEEGLDTSEQSPPKPTPEQLVDIVDTTLSLCKKEPASNWPRCASLLKDLSSDLEVRDARFTQIVLDRGRGSEEELEILKCQEYPEVDNWAVEYLQKMRLEKPSETNESYYGRGTHAAALIAFLSEKKHPQTDTLAQSLFRTGDPEWAGAVLESADDVGPELAQEVIRETMKQAIEKKSGRLLESVFDELDSVRLPNPQEIIALIDQLPDGKADDDWEKSKKTAREQLMKMETISLDEEKQETR